MNKLTILMAMIMLANSSYAQYCNPNTTSPCATGTVRIHQVVTSGNGATSHINNTSNSCGNVYPGYSYYTGTGNTLSAPAGLVGASSNGVKISVNPGIVGGAAASWSYRCYVWVDWNHDGVFNNVSYNPGSPATDTGELMIVNPNMSSPQSRPLDFPPRAKHGLTRMRIRLYGGTSSTNFPPISPVADPCAATGTINGGEVEDYDVFCDNPCVKIPAVSFSNTNYKGTDVSWVPKGNEHLLEYAVDESPNDPGTGNTLIKNYTTSMHLPDANMKYLKCNTKYYFHIRSVCDTLDGNNQAMWYYGPWRTESFTTEPCCDLPIVSVSDIKANTALAAWGPVSTVKLYEYQVRMDTLIGTTGMLTNNTSLNLQGLQCSQMYYFYLRALCSPTPTSDWSVDSFLTQPCLSIDNRQVIREFKINAYPNPAKDVVTLSVLHGMKSSQAQITVTDIAGKIVLTVVMVDDKVNIDLRTQTAGIYFVKYADEERTEVVRISKD